MTTGWVKEEDARHLLIRSINSIAVNTAAVISNCFGYALSRQESKMASPLAFSLIQQFLIDNDVTVARLHDPLPHEPLIDKDVSVVSLTGQLWVDHPDPAWPHLSHLRGLG